MARYMPYPNTRRPCDTCGVRYKSPMYYRYKRDQPKTESNVVYYARCNICVEKVCIIDPTCKIPVGRHLHCFMCPVITNQFDVYDAPIKACQNLCAEHRLSDRKYAATHSIILSSRIRDNTYKAALTIHITVDDLVLLILQYATLNE